MAAAVFTMPATKPMRNPTASEARSRLRTKHLACCTAEEQQDFSVTGWPCPPNSSLIPVRLAGDAVWLGSIHPDTDVFMGSAISRPSGASRRRSFL